VAWRQNEQTYDGGTLVNKSIPKTTVTYGHFTEVNSVFGVQFPIRADLANVAVALADGLKLSAYDYRLDFDDANVGNRQDSETLGLRATGTVPFGEVVSLSYAAEFARQTDFGDSPDRTAAYRLAEAGVTWAIVTVKLGQEVLGSDDGTYAVQTPLATLHAHDGWADMFLTTPAKGLRRDFATAAATFAGVTLTAVYHAFAADHGDADYGSEVDASIGYAFNKQLSGLVKYASYSANDAPATTFATNADTDKGWLQLEYKF
jgi:hypothetical protein